jgi:hypothetical protein
MAGQPLLAVITWVNGVGEQCGHRSPGPGLPRAQAESGAGVSLGALVAQRLAALGGAAEEVAYLLRPAEECVDRATGKLALPAGGTPWAGTVATVPTGGPEFQATH